MSGRIGPPQEGGKALSWLCDTGKGKVILFLLFLLIVYLVVVGITKKWGLGIIGEFFEGYRAWNECPVHGTVPVASNRCMLHNGGSLGALKRVEIMEMKQNGCNCTCTCPRAASQSNDLIAMPELNQTAMPNVAELQSYAKNMWDAVVNTSPNGAVAPAPMQKPSGFRL